MQMIAMYLVFVVLHNSCQKMCQSNNINASDGVISLSSLKIKYKLNVSHDNILTIGLDEMK